MKKFIFTCLALSMATLGLTSCRKNRITIIETAYMVTHPAAHRGDLLVFEVPPAGDGKRNYVHFVPGISPCAADTISAPPGKPLECRVFVNPPTETRYLYYIDAQPETIHRGTCPPWCTQVVVGPAPGLGSPFAPPPSSSYPAEEIMISSNSKGEPVSANASAYQSQPVTWFKNGPDPNGWTVLFSDDICVEKQPIVSGHGEVAYCTLKTDAPKGYHSYTVTVDKTTGPPSQLYVVPTSSSIPPIVE